MLVIVGICGVRACAFTMVADRSKWSFLSMDLSMNSRLRVPVEASSHELVQAGAHVG